jgi:hypothetical protein
MATLATKPFHFWARASAPPCRGPESQHRKGNDDHEECKQDRRLSCIDSDHQRERAERLEHTY